MNNNDTQILLSQSLETLSVTIADRCYNDSIFDRDFRKDPAGVLQRDEGINLPPGQFQFHIHDNDESNWHIVLPDLGTRKQVSRVLTMKGTLSDEEMDTISAGIGQIAGFVIGTVVAVAVIVVTGVAVGLAAGLPGAAAIRKQGRMNKQARNKNE